MKVATAELRAGFVETEETQVSDAVHASEMRGAP